MKKLAVLLSISALLAACGSGGGDVSSTTATETQTASSAPDSTSPSDRFIGQEWAVIQATSETAEPSPVGTSVSSLPENAEPSPLS